MKSHGRSHMLLLELVLMIFIFSICAAVCISIFTSSRQMSDDSRNTGHAVSWAQSAAEAYKAAEGDSAEAASYIGAQTTDNGFVMNFDSDWTETDANGRFRLELEGKDGTAHIRVTDGEKVLFSLEAKAVRYE